MAKRPTRAQLIEMAVEAAFGSLSRLAHKADLSKQLLSFAVRGERGITDATLAAIADALEQKSAESLEVVAAIKREIGR